MSTPLPTRTPPARDRWAFDRSDRWGLGLLLALVALSTVAYHLVRPLTAWAGGRPIAVPYSSEVTVPTLDQAGQAYSTADYQLLLHHPSGADRLIDLVPGIAFAAVAVAACALLVAVMRDIGAGDPFHARNVTRLRVLAGLLAFGLPVAAFARMACNGRLLSGASLGDLPLVATFTVPWQAIVAGTTVALLAEAFRAGARLRHDVDGLI